jgi:hypothetical protein
MIYVTDWCSIDSDMEEDKRNAYAHWIEKDGEESCFNVLTDVVPSLD